MTSQGNTMHKGTTKRTHLKRAAAAGAVALLAGVLAAGPAAAGGSGTLYTGRDFARATTSTWGGTQGQSHAQHGTLRATSAWTLVSSSAKADAGTSTTSLARISFR